MMHESPSPVLETAELTFKYRSAEALNGLDLEVHEGEIFGLLGPNGAGKSTALALALGLLRPRSGTARIFGVDGRRLGPVEKARIGLVDEEQDWPKWMSLDRLARQLRPLYPTWDDAFYDDLCTRFELDRRRPVGKMSRGQRMRARMVLALAYRPRLLILDEPFAGLDPMVRADVVDGLLDLTEQERWTIVLATHEMALAERLVDRVGFLDGGRMSLVDDLDRLRARTRRVRVELAAPYRAGADWPDAWSRPEIDGRHVRFVDFAADTADIEAPYGEYFGDLVSVSASELSLEAIFVAHHQHQRGASS
ncbi:MAG: ABC transporter ATP-binding protein [Acidobacteriota bacterium]